MTTAREKELKYLKQKSKVGWACFFNAQNENHRLNEKYMDALRTLQNGIEGRDKKHYEKDHIPEFIKNEIKGLIEELKKSVECPICYEELKSDEIQFSGCGHKYCGECLKKLDNCAVCRRKIYHKKG
mgnify:CR=1 FL=1